MLTSHRHSSCTYQECLEWGRAPVNERSRYGRFREGRNVDLLLGKARKLRDIVEARIHNTLKTGLLETREKMLCALFGEANSENFHVAATLSACSIASSW